MYRRRILGTIYYIGLIVISLFIPLAIIGSVLTRGDEVTSGWVGGILAFIVLMAYLIIPNILGRRDE
ncbi:hypothetical protein [Mechercharimyces sp. CAU 1602]|uniref:hypothetical protein n=1 Tax=Mechercharimyces sp. CAU 1602 TaxID=2973933 RepID=UPI002161AF98|nr:hypothetical protein [Mechercharimyces sp. CAU 1602]MCS1351759.1 hypothetical protein [Mechercharimyces sp. CAU 1602]